MRQNFRKGNQEIRTQSGKPASLFRLFFGALDSSVILHSIARKPVPVLNPRDMRKWMRDRLKRGKKKVEPDKSENAPTPLQPAYFDAEPVKAESSVSPEPPRKEAKEAEVESEPPRSSPGATEGKEAPARRRRRRGRGGRGRGGRSSNAAVAPPAAEAAPTEAPEIARTKPAPAESTPSKPKGAVVLAIGLPGSGKSSWFKRHQITPLSSDFLRSILFDDATEQRFQDLVFSNLRSMLKARLIARRPMSYVDATNLTPHERHSWIKLAKDYGYEVHAVYFDVPVDVCVERNRHRERVVGEDIVRRLAAKLKAPTFEEGFSKITVVKVKKKPGEAAEAVEAS